MMEQAARRAKDLVRLTDVLARYNLTPNRAGFLHCPFHSGDRDASLKIYPATDSWYCFGCGEGGDVIDFVAKMERCSFTDALKKLNTDFCLGLEEKQSLRDARQRKQERAREILGQKRKETSCLIKSLTGALCGFPAKMPTLQPMSGRSWRRRFWPKSTSWTRRLQR